MPSANTKPVATRIPKDHYYLLLREAADRQMTISKFLEDVVIRSFLTPNKKENGGYINGRGVTTIRVIAFKEEPNVVVRRIDNKWHMYSIVREGDYIVQMSKGKIGYHTEARGYPNDYYTRFEGFDIYLHYKGSSWCKGVTTLNAKEIDLKIMK